MKVGATKSVRCAIYTRVSTDQGLEQDFNSLHAQCPPSALMRQIGRVEEGRISGSS
jgi:hypothetical protein